MQNKPIIINILSNWANFVLVIGISFFVSPILVKGLGDQSYGVWTLIISLTGYFTVLDFGINTAIVRFISKYFALKKQDKIIEIFSTSKLFFGCISFFVLILSFLFSIYFKSIFDISGFDRYYLAATFFIIGTDLALGLFFSVQLATLWALQKFHVVNIISSTVVIIKNIVIVIAILNGYSILILAIIQITSNSIKYLLQFIYIKSRFNFIKFKKNKISSSTFKDIFDYSIYSFLIALSIKALFYTDSVVIGSFLSVSDITFYAIPATIVDYLEKLVWAIISVLIPIISSQEANGNTGATTQIYVDGSRYILYFSLPILIVLYTAGEDFIRLWMGNSYSARSGEVLRILVIGYFLGLSQLVAHGVLKGISLHKVLAYLLCFEALVNLALSIILCKSYGINGVAIGTATPLIFVNLICIPLYTCKKLHISYFKYIIRTYLTGIIMFGTICYIYHKFNYRINSYFELIVYCIVICIIVFIFMYCFALTENHKNIVRSKLLKIKKLKLNCI